MGKKVLIIEDEKPLAHALELKLKASGYEVQTASNGQEGLATLTTFEAEVVLLDLMMPVMDGFQVLEQLRRAPHMPHIIVLSNLGQHEDEDRVLKLGAKQFFVKSDTPLGKIVEAVESAG